MLNDLKKAFLDQEEVLHISLPDSLESVVDSLSEIENVLFLFFELRDKDINTFNHSLRTAIYTLALWEQAKIPYNHYNFAGVLMHDIGKMQEDILDIIKKRYPNLTLIEYEMIKLHPLYGVRMVKSLIEDLPFEFYKPIYFHHERMDGYGYPFGRFDKSLYPVVKALSICDTFDAMVHRGVYQDTKPLDYVLSYLAHLSLPRKEKFTFEQVFELANINIRKLDINYGKRECGGYLDKQLVRDFVSLFSEREKIKQYLGVSLPSD
ncbi:MAG: HD domain-containing phosphohydrolase [archaeon]